MVAKPTLILEWQRKGILKPAEGESRRQIYNDYINSPEWKRKRQQRLEIDGFECRCCAATENLEVHHKTYDRFGREDVNRDLTTLCDRCHAAIHTSLDQRRGKKKPSYMRKR